MYACDFTILKMCLNRLYMFLLKTEKIICPWDFASTIIPNDVIINITIINYKNLILNQPD